MADNSTNSNSILGVVIGALLVLMVGGGILYATGALDSKPANVTIQQPAATPAAAPAPAPVQKEPDRSRWDDRRDRSDGRRDGDNDRRDRDGWRDNDRRDDRSDRR